MIANRHFLLSHPKALSALQALALSIFALVLISLFIEGEGDRLLKLTIAGIGACVILRLPHLGVLIILTTWLINVDALGSQFVSMPYLASAILVIPLGLSILRDRGSWVLQVPQIKIFLAIGLLFLISTWWSELKYAITIFPERDQTFREMQLFVTRLIWLIFFLYFITTRRRIETTIWLVLGLIVAAAFTALFPFLAGGGIRRAAAAFSLAENSNRLAFICLFATTLFWYYRFHGQTPRSKNWTLPFLVLLPLTALTSASRSGLLQMVALAALIVRDQKGWSAMKRINCIFFMGLILVVMLAVVPESYLGRATTFDPQASAPGQQSLQNRLRVVLSAVDMLASDPVFGAGIGNFPWVARAYFGSGGHTHNSYFWAAISGGLGVLILYLILFYITYRMLKQLEISGPPRLLWLSKGLQVNLILFLIFSAFADFWLSDFLYLIVGLTVAMSYLWRHETQELPFDRLQGSAFAMRSRG